MDTAILIWISFAAGAVTSSLIVWWVFRKIEKRMERDFVDRGKIAKREFELHEKELKQELERSYEQRRLQLERDYREREVVLQGREDEAVSTLLAAEKERESVEKRRLELDSKLSETETRLDQIREESSAYRQRLHEIASMSKEEVHAELFRIAEEDCQGELTMLRENLLGKGEKQFQREARGILISAMQRMSAKPHEDISATIVSLPSEDMKGRIIGREGRNIKAFESFTGTTLLIDETPDSVLVSSFDPVRREIARIALESLIKDGRIHPGSIEEAVKTAEDEVQQSVVETGEEVLMRLRLSKMHPEIVRALGQMRFRLSNNQNLLEHSVEVAQLCALMAAELQIDPKIAKRAGLLHDIGKILDQDHEGSHARAGANFLKRVGNEDPLVINAVAAHHEEIPAESPYVGLVMIADSISAMRPGARADSLDGYIQRIRNLEGIASGVDGVVESYAIQAGREIRIIVSPEKVAEKDAALLARNVRRRIEDELQYPGSIKVTVIREQRFEELAR